MIQDAPTKPNHVKIPRINQSKQPGNLSIFAALLAFQLGFFLEIEESKNKEEETMAESAVKGGVYRGIFLRVLIH